MAISDMLTLAFPSPLFLYMYTFGNHTKPLTPASVCYIWNLLYEVREFLILLPLNNFINEK